MNRQTKLYQQSPISNHPSLISTIQSLTLILVLLLAAAGCNGRQSTWNHIQQTGTLRVGLDPTYPPFEVADADNVWGLDVDLANALAAELGLQAQFVYFGYDGLYDALLTKQVDVLISALVVDESRTRDFAFSEPYFNAGQILIVPESEGKIADMADLNGRIVAVELGSQGHVEALNWQRKVPNLQILPTNSPDDALTAVLEQTAHAALTDAISGRLFLSQHPGLKRLPDPVTVEPFALVVRKEDGQLLQHLNEALETIQNNGQLEMITAQWLDQGN